MKTQRSAEFLKKRKFLMVLPLLVLPFFTMAFWALGGGKGSDNRKTALEIQKGFNTELPEAKFNPDEKQDKFSVYEASAKDSQKTKDGYSQLAFSENQEGFTDPNEDRINKKLAQINSEISKQTSPESNYSNPMRSRKSDHSVNMSNDVNRLENLMQNMQSDKENDPEMRQLNTLLEKVLDVQHPERAKEKQKEASLNNAQGAYAVHVADGKTSLFSITQELNSKQTEYVANGIQAIIHQNQDIVSGSVVKLRLLDSIYINGTLIPKNEFIYGIASVDAERLKIEIGTLRYRNSILPVALSAFDLDGLEGLYIPGAITREAAKSGVDDAIQSLQIMTMDPSATAQVAGAGIKAAKGLFSRKVKLVKVKVKAGYQLLLRDNNQKN